MSKESIQFVITGNDGNGMVLRVFKSPEKYVGVIRKFDAELYTFSPGTVKLSGNRLTNDDLRLIAIKLEMLNENKRVFVSMETT